MNRPAAGCAGVIAVTLVALLGITPAAAQQRIEDCLTAVRLRPDDDEAYRCFWLVARRTGDAEAAVSALAVLEAAHPDDPRPLRYEAAIRADHGDPLAPELLERAAAGFAARADPVGEVYVQLSLAHWYSTRFRPDLASSYLTKARSVATAAGDALLMTRVEVAQGWQAVGAGDFALARREFERLASRVLEEGPYDLKLDVLNGLGYVGWATGRYRSALVAYRRVAALTTTHGDLQESATARYNALLMVWRLAGEGNEVVANDLLEEALEAAIEVGNRDLEARLRLARSEDLPPVEAAREVQRALDLQGSVDDSELLLAALRRCATIEVLGLGQTQRGLARLRDSIDLARELRLEDGVVRGRALLANLLWETGDDAAALPASLEALDSIEEVSRRQSAPEERSRVAARHASAYRQLAGRLLSRGGEDDIGLALAVMERLRSRGYDPGRGGPVAGPSDGGMAAAEVGAIQRELASDEALLVYQLAESYDTADAWQGGSWLIVVTTQQVAVLPLLDRSRIEASVDLLLGLAVDRGARYDDSLTALGDRVLPLELDGLLAGVERLVVVPDGDLHSLPFGLLRRSGSDGYLIERYTVATVPSVSQWLAWRAHEMRIATAAVLALADPAIPGAARQDARWRDGRLGALPYARREARRVCARLGGDSILLDGDAATERAFLAAVPRRLPILHFATHSVVDRDEPARSAVLLAADPAAGDDGALSIDEIAGLDLTDTLVVLASCRSASGVVLQGEGVLGLTRAFLAAGARAVVGTLWPVEDRASAELVDRLYAGLARGDTVVAALAAAQRRCLADGAPPAGWAGFVVIGDARFRVAPHATGSGLHSVPAVVAVVLVAAVLTAIAVHGRHRRQPADPPDAAEHGSRGAGPDAGRSG